MESVSKISKYFLEINYFSDWLRHNCMQVFHWCGDQLKDLPVFEERAVRPKEILYNDFDYDPDSEKFIDEEANDISYNEHISDIDLSDEDLVPYEAVEHAVIDADTNEGILADHTTFEHPSFDISDTVDDDYLEKVKNLIVSEMAEYPLSEK